MPTNELACGEAAPSLWINSADPCSLAIASPQFERLVETGASVIRALAWVLDVHLGRDPHTIAEVLGLGDQEDWVALLLDSGRFEAGIHRCDLVMQASEPKVLECNVGNAGGWMLAARHARWRGSDEATGDAGWRTIDTVGPLVEYLLAELPHDAVSEDESVLIGFVIDRSKGSEEEEFDDALLAHCRAHLHATRVCSSVEAEIEIDYVEWSELCCADQQVVARGGQRVAVLFELDVVSSSQRLLATELAAEGRVALIAGPFARIANDKRLLCILSAWLDAGNEVPGVDTGLLRHALPRTRMLRARAHACANMANMDCDPDEAKLARRRLVLKKAVSDGGVGVYIGSAIEAGQWTRLVDLAVEEGDWIIQQWIEPDLEWGLDRLDPVHVIWGPFFVGGRFAGGFGRILSLDGYVPDRSAAVAGSPNADSRVDVLPFHWRDERMPGGSPFHI